MAEYIEREAVIKFAESNKAVSQALADITDIREIVNDVPSADVQPVKHGYWTRAEKPYPYYDYKCSECGCEEYRHIDSKGNCVLMKYCPNCGAKMDGGAKK